jgi:hypothetical protein
MAASLLCGFILNKQNLEKLTLYTDATIIMCVIWVVTRIIYEGLITILETILKNEKKD